MSNISKFNLFWKSNYSLNNASISDAIFQLDKEIEKYEKTVDKFSQDSYVKTIMEKTNELREYRKKLVSLKKDYDERRFPRSGTEIDQNKDKSFGEDDGRVEFSDKKKMKKNSFYNDKISTFKSLYVKTWGSLDGFSESDVSKMSEEDLDKAISSLENIFDKSFNKVSSSMKRKILDDPVDAYYDGVGVETIKEVLREAGVREREIKEVEDQIY